MRFVLYILLVMELVVGVEALPVQQLVSELRLLEAGRMRLALGHQRVRSSAFLMCFLCFPLGCLLGPRTKPSCAILSS